MCCRVPSILPSCPGACYDASRSDVQYLMYLSHLYNEGPHQDNDCCRPFNELILYKQKGLIPA